MASRAVLVDDRLPARDDGVERLVPGDALELLGALRPDPLHRVEQPVGMVVALLVVLQLHAETAAGHRVVRVAAHAEQLAVLDLEQHRAGVRAIVRAAAEEGLGQALGLGDQQGVGLDDLVHVSSTAERPALLFLAGRPGARSTMHSSANNSKFWPGERAKRVPGYGTNRFVAAADRALGPKRRGADRAALRSARSRTGWHLWN